jgi:ferredoxin-NADP reductase
LGADVPETGATPKVPPRAKAVLKAVQRFTSPLLPDDYLELVNPLWSTRELRGRIEGIERETEDAATVLIKPGWEWEGHEPGQYIRVGFDVEGVRHWRAYSLTSDPHREDGLISITVKGVETGKVSSYVTRKLREGAIITLGEVAGEFKLPAEVPEKALFISAGSGITPIMSMIRDLAHRDALSDTVLIHSARHADDVIFGGELRELAGRHEGFELLERHTAKDPRFSPGELDELCPDWREREAFVSGPSDLLDALVEHWERHGDEDKLHLERFQPTYGEGGAEAGEGGTIRFLRSEADAESDGGQSILVAGEAAGLDLPYGCRMGICHTCTGRLCSGQVRDLRSGEVHDLSGQTIRTCIHAPEGDVEIEL